MTSEKVGNGWIVSRSVATGTSARTARLTWPIHSPASGPTATAPATTLRWGSAKSLRKPGRFGSWKVDVRELRDSRHVAGGPDVLGRAQTLVHLDALPPDLQAKVLEPEPVDVGLPPGGDHEVGRLQRPAALELEPIAARTAFDPFRAPVEADVDPLLLEELAEQLARVAVRAREDVIAALDDGHLAAQAGVELRELAAHGPASDYNEAFRHLARARPLAARPGLNRVQTIDRRHLSERAGRDHQLVVRELAPVHLDP